jgi:hypothetical protein
MGLSLKNAPAMGAPSENARSGQKLSFRPITKQA